MPPQLIVSPQFEFGKAEQFTPELLWQWMVFKVDREARLITRARQKLRNMRPSAWPTRTQSPSHSALPKIWRAVAIHGRSTQIAMPPGMLRRANRGSALRREWTPL